MDVAPLPRMWWRLILLLAAPYAALLPLLLTSHKKPVVEFLHRPPATFPCEGTSARVELRKRPPADAPPALVPLPRRGWKRVDSDRVWVESNVSPTELQSIARLIEAASASLEETFGLSVRRPVRVRLFATREAYRPLAESFGRGRAASFFDAAKDEIVLPRSATAAELAQVLHTLVHRSIKAPAWLDEGLAELVSCAAFDNGFRWDFRRPDWAALCREPLKLADVPSTKPEEIRQPRHRARAAMLLHLLVRRHGPWAVRLLLQGAKPQDLPRWAALADDEREYAAFLQAKTK